MYNPYKAIDKALQSAIKSIDADFNNTALTLPNDELNYPTARSITSNLFARVLEITKQVYLKGAENALNDARMYLARYGYWNTKEGDLIALKTKPRHVVDAVLTGYSPVTGYRFVNEYERKRDRTMEALLAYAGLQAYRQALKRSHDYTVRQIKANADLVIDEAYYQAYKEAGVTQVMWITERDKRVCEVCKARDGKIYKLTEVPDKPHINCRCHLRPIRKGSSK